MPCQDRIGRYDGGDLTQDLPAQWLPFGCQSATLVIGKMPSLPARLELLLQDAILFDQVGDNGRLLATDPPGERSQEELEMNRFNHPASVSDVRQVVALICDRVFGHYAIAPTALTCTKYTYKRPGVPDSLQSVPAASAYMPMVPFC